MPNTKPERQSFTIKIYPRTGAKFNLYKAQFFTSSDNASDVLEELIRLAYEQKSKK